MRTERVQDESDAAAKLVAEGFCYVGHLFDACASNLFAEFAGIQQMQTTAWIGPAGLRAELAPLEAGGWEVTILEPGD